MSLDACSLNKCFPVAVKECPISAEIKRPNTYVIVAYFHHFSQPRSHPVIRGYKQHV